MNSLIFRLCRKEYLLLIWISISAFSISDATAIVMCDGAVLGSIGTTGSSQQQTTVTLSASDLTPSPNQSVELTAIIKGCTPTGTVTFSEGTNLLCSNVPVSNVPGSGTDSKAVCTVKSFTPGQHDLSASYSGDSENSASKSVNLSITVSSVAKTSLTITPSTFQPSSNQSVALTATIAGGINPSGTITFSEGTNALCSNITVSNSNAVCTVDSFAPGPHILSAFYTGDIGNSASSSENITLNTLIATSLNMKALHSHILSNHSVDLIASITGGINPGGKVTFRQGTNMICNQVVDLNSKAKCTKNGFSVGQYNFSAEYSGDATNSASVSDVINITVANANKPIVMPTYDVFKNALINARHSIAGDSGNEVWAVMMDRTGVVRAVTFSGPTSTSQWPAGRVLAAALANTANAINTETLFFSTANLYSHEKTGWVDIDSMSLPVNTIYSYGGTPSLFGGKSDPLMGKRPGGWQISGGGLSLMDMYGRVLGSIGVAGTTPCTNHNIAWKLRNILNLDYVSGGIGPDLSRPDNILYSGILTDSAFVGFTHPVCSSAETTETANLPVVQH